jgi:phage-related protein
MAAATRRETERLQAVAFDWSRGFELRDQDVRSWYRVIYLSRINDVIYVLHCFEKKSREMPRRDFERARQRFKLVKARLAEEKRNEKHR